MGYRVRHRGRKELRLKLADLLISFSAALLRRGPSPAHSREAAVDPEPAQLLLERVLAEARAQVGEVDLVDRLILVEAGEHHSLLAGGGVALHLQALRT